MRHLHRMDNYTFLFRAVGVFVLVWIINASRFANPSDSKTVYPGAERMGLYLDSLKGKRVAVVANQTSVIKGVHLVDTLRCEEINLVKIFAPEHGFRGEGDAGEHINSSFDEQTGIPVVSLYGNHKKPTEHDLMDVDVMFRPGAVVQAKEKSALKAAPVYMYLMTWQSPVMDGKYKAFHCME